MKGLDLNCCRNRVGPMQFHRGWGLLALLLAAGALSVPALAQQPAADAPSSAAPPAAAAKPHKHKHAADPAEAVAGGTKPTLLGQYGDWGAYTASPGGKKICFAIAKPSSSETNPPNRPRNPAYMFISSRPGDKVSNEISVIIGYPFKSSTEATLAVGSANFALYTQQDGAWIKDAAEEPKLVEALRAAQSAVVRGASAKGTRTTDIFSLKGLAQALDRSDKDCK
jgi:Invasion associated locus B (IalB) protein